MRPAASAAAVHWDGTWENLGGLRLCLVPAVSPKIPVTSNVWTHAWSIKYKLITKLISQLATNLRDESFKPN